MASEARHNTRNQPTQTNKSSCGQFQGCSREQVSGFYLGLGWFVLCLCLLCCRGQRIESWRVGVSEPVSCRMPCESASRFNRGAAWQQTVQEQQPKTKQFRDFESFSPRTFCSAFFCMPFFSSALPLHSNFSSPKHSLLWTSELYSLVEAIRRGRVLGMGPGGSAQHGFKEELPRNGGPS